jgi:hypothetical protein
LAQSLKAKERIKEHRNTAPGKPKTPDPIRGQVKPKKKRSTSNIVAKQTGLGSATDKKIVNK